MWMYACMCMWERVCLFTKLPLRVDIWDKLAQFQYSIRHQFINRVDQKDEAKKKNEYEIEPLFSQLICIFIPLIMQIRLHRHRRTMSIYGVYVVPCVRWTWTRSSAQYYNNKKKKKLLENKAQQKHMPGRESHTHTQNKHIQMRKCVDRTTEIG